MELRRKSAKVSLCVFRGLLAWCVTCLALVASADVTDVRDNGFLSSNTITVNATAEASFAALLQVGRWWDPQHTYSGDSANMTLAAQPGGCFCETTGHGGQIQHMQVVYVQPGKILRLSGGLGPLQQDGVAGSLTWSVKQDAGTTTMTQTYSVGGYRNGGFAEMAPLVDQVLTIQLQRLQRYIETGSPDAPAAPTK